MFDDGQGERRVVDGITAIAAHKRNAGLPGLRFFHPRASKLFAALMAADADVYYQSPAGAFTGITAWFCRMTGRKFIFRVASDSDCEKEHGRIRLWRDRRLFDYGLRHADLVAVQTHVQAQMLRADHALESSARQHAGGAAAAQPRRPSTRTSTYCGCPTCVRSSVRNWCSSWRASCRR